MSTLTDDTITMTCIIHTPLCHLRILLSFESGITWVVNRELLPQSFFFVVCANNIPWFILAVTASCANEKSSHAVLSFHHKGDRPAANYVDVIQDFPIFDDDII